MPKISENVYVETNFQGCNTDFVITAEGVVVIDTPMIPSEMKKWSDEAAKYGPISYVINTEPRLDHFAGNCYFDGIVVGHKGTREAKKGWYLLQVMSAERCLSFVKPYHTMAG